MYKIDKGIPIQKFNSLTKYPWAEMEVGDSFFVPGTRVTRLNGSKAYWERKLSTKYITRTKEGGVRVWRIE